MRQREKNLGDELRPEYDLASLLNGGVKGKHAKEYSAGSNLVLIEPEIYSEFKTGKEVNEALRLVIQLRKIGRPGRRRT